MKLKILLCQMYYKPNLPIFGGEIFLLPRCVNFFISVTDRSKYTSKVEHRDNIGEKVNHEIRVEGVLRNQGLEPVRLYIDC